MMGLKLKKVASGGEAARSYFGRVFNSQKGNVYSETQNTLPANTYKYGLRG